MAHFLLRRLLLTIPVLLGVATLVFSLIHLVPGDPVQAMLGESASPQEVAEVSHRLGLDRPLYVQYWAFLKGAARGDLGVSLRTNEPVAAGHRRPDAGDIRAGHRGDGPGGRDRDSAGDHRRRRRRHRRRLRGDDARAARHLDAELLARAAARDSVFGDARLAAGVRQRHGRASRPAGDYARRRRSPPCWRE